MGKRRPKHDKSRDRRNYTYHPKRTFSLRWDPDPGPCYLFALDERQAALLRKMVQVFPKYHYIWGLPTPQADWDAATWQLWDEISAFVDELEACLVSGCDVGELNKSIRQLTAVVGGLNVDLTQPIPDLVDYTQTGISPLLVQLANINTTLTQIRDILEALDFDDFGELTNLQQLTNINTTLSGFDLDDLSALGELTNINTTLSGFDLDDLSALGELTNLQQLSELANINVTLDELDVTIPQFDDINQNLAYLAHLQVLGGLPGSGDTIQASLWKLVEAQGGGQSLQDLIDAINNADFVGGGFLDDLRDFLEILTFLKLLFGGQAPATFALGYWDKIKLFRYFHNDLTLKAYQATALKGIQYGITPFEKDGEDYDGSDEGILAELENIPWLTDVIGKYLSDDPVQIVRKISYLIGGKLGVISRVVTSIVVAWDWWYNKWINLVGDPQPVRTLTGVLTQISDKLVHEDEDYGTTGLPASLFGMLQGLTWTQVSPQDELDNSGISTSNRLQKIAEHLEALDLDMPEGVTWQTLFNQIDTTLSSFDLNDLSVLAELTNLQELTQLTNINTTVGNLNTIMNDLDLSVVNNVNVTCAQCGCEGEQPPSEPIIEGGPPPEGWEEPTDPDTGQPTGPGEPAYQSRKCKVANILWEELRGYLVAFADNDVPSTVGFGAGAILLVVTQIVKVGVIAAGAGPIGIAVVLVIGSLAGLVLAFYGSTLDLARMIQILDDYQEDLVCALYNATSADQGHANFRQIMDDNGAQPGDLALYDALMIYDALNTLFARMTGDDGDVLEAALDGYTGPVDCSVCVGCVHGVQYGQIDSDDGSVMVMTALLQQGYYRVSVAFNNSVAEMSCPTVTLTGITVLSGIVDSADAIDAYRIAAQGDGPGVYSLHSSDLTPTLPLVGVANPVITSTVPFTIQFDYTTEV